MKEAGNKIPVSRIFKVSGYTFKGSNLAIFTFAFLKRIRVDPILEGLPHPGKQIVSL